MSTSTSSPAPPAPRGPPHPLSPSPFPSRSGGRRPVRRAPPRPCRRRGARPWLALPGESLGRLPLDRLQPRHGRYRLGPGPTRPGLGRGTVPHAAAAPFATSGAGSTASATTGRIYGSTITSRRSPSSCSPGVHRAPGIGLGRIGILPYLEDAEIELPRSAARRALPSAAGFGGNQSLCHGDLGNLEIVREAGRVLADAG